MHGFFVDTEWRSLPFKQILDIFPDTDTPVGVPVTKPAPGIVVVLRSKVTILAQVFVNLNYKRLIIN